MTMTKIFLHIFNLSITASWLIAAVLLVRWIIKGKTPRWVSCLLWAFVGLRLVIPFYFESDFSIIPSKETVIPEAVYGEVSQEIREPEVSAYEQIGGETGQIGGEVSVSPLPETSVGENITADGNQAEPEKIEVAPSKKEPTEYIHSGFQALDERVNEVINEAESEETAEEVGVVRRVTEAASVVWLCGVVLMLVYAAVNYLLLKKRVSVFVPEKGNIRRSENVGSPFILGFVRPKIYLPFGLTKETEEHIIAHELAHLNRRDHWIKPFGFAILSVYWFNPLVWVAYILLCRDIEYACDEKVVKEMGEDARKAYATALLECGVKRNMIAACPVAFGEIGVKDRVKSALSYKKPMLWIIIAAVVISAVTAGVFLLAPKDGEDASSADESSETVSEEVSEESEEESDVSDDTSGDNTDDGSATVGILPEGDFECVITVGENEYAVEDETVKNGILSVLNGEHEETQSEIGEGESISLIFRQEGEDPEALLGYEEYSYYVEYTFYDTDIIVWHHPTVSRQEKYKYPEGTYESIVDLLKDIDYGQNAGANQVIRGPGNPMQPTHETPENASPNRDLFDLRYTEITPIYIQMIDVDRLFVRVDDRGMVSSGNTDDGHINEKGLKLWICTQSGERIDYVYTNSKGLARFECTEGVYNIYFDGAGKWASKYCGTISIGPIYNPSYQMSGYQYRKYSIYTYHDVYENFKVYVTDVDTKEPLQGIPVKIADTTVYTNANGVAEFKPLLYYIKDKGSSFQISVITDKYDTFYYKYAHMYQTEARIELSETRIIPFTISFKNKETNEPIAGVVCGKGDGERYKLDNTVSGADGKVTGTVSTKEMNLGTAIIVYISYTKEYDRGNGPESVTSYNSVVLNDYMSEYVLYVTFYTFGHTIRS